MPGSPRGRGFIPRGGGGGTPPRPPYFPRGSPRGGRGGRTGGGEDWRRVAGPEYEEYTERGGSRGTSPGGRYTRVGRAGGGENWRRDTGQEYEEYTKRGAPGGHHQEVGTPG